MFHCFIAKALMEENIGGLIVSQLRGPLLSSWKEQKVLKYRTIRVQTEWGTRYIRALNLGQA